MLTTVNYLVIIETTSNDTVYRKRGHTWTKYLKTNKVDE